MLKTPKKMNKPKRKKYHIVFSVILCYNYVAKLASYVRVTLLRRNL